VGLLFVFAAVHVLVPLLVLVWQWRGSVASRLQWWARTLAFGGYLVALLLAGFWTILPRWLAWLYLALFAVTSVVSWRRAQSLPSRAPGAQRHRVDVAVHLAFAVVFLAATGYAASGRMLPGTAAVELTFPLHGGHFVVGSGGSNRLLNLHLRTLHEPRLEPWRGQSYAVDILELNHFGIRAQGLAPDDPRHYVIFGREVLAPCPGRVIESRDGLPDTPNEDRDGRTLAGNFVMLDCGGYHVLLAHLKQGSVQTKPGESVATGQALGEVGNSGNSSEPHLHIHAQRPGSALGALDGEPLPIRFGGRYLVRNDRVRY
jgi:hypothetical protein